jgi:hypothetical protein
MLERFDLYGLPNSAVILGVPISLVIRIEHGVVQGALGLGWILEYPLGSLNSAHWYRLHTKIPISTFSNAVSRF